METVSKLSIILKFKGYLSLLKLRLSSLVVMSAFFGYLLADGDVLSFEFIELIIGGLFITGSANGFNQILEYKTDELMSRTSLRALPSKILNIGEAILFSSIVGIFGLYLLLELNFISFILGLLSMVIYTLIYTPLKKITPLAVFIGAIPGSIPPLLGYVSVTNTFGLEPGVLFMIQFFWQFPHFWALAWKLDNDYKKAGFRLLPSGERNQKSAFQIMLYSAFLVPISMLPWAAEMTGLWSMILGILISLIM